MEMAGEHPKFVEIKNPFGSFQTNPKAHAWWVPPFFLLKKVVFVKHPNGDMCFQLMNLVPQLIFLFVKGGKHCDSQV